MKGSIGTLCLILRLDMMSSVVKLWASLRVTLKRTCFAAIPYTTHAFYGVYGNSPQIRNDRHHV